MPCLSAVAAPHGGAGCANLTTFQPSGTVLCGPSGPLPPGRIWQALRACLTDFGYHDPLPHYLWREGLFSVAPLPRCVHGIERWD